MANKPIIGVESPDLEDTESMDTTTLNLLPDAKEFAAKQDTKEPTQEEKAISAPDPEAHESIEEKAKQEGWRPKKEWSGDPSNWRSAREYMEKRELLNEISKSHKEIKELKKFQLQVADYINQREMVAYDKAIKELKNQLVIAAEEGNGQQVSKIHDEIVNLQHNLAVQAPQMETSNDRNKKIVENFTNRNAAWYNDNTADNTAMKAFAIAKEKEYLAAYPNLDPETILYKVEQDVKSKYVASVSKHKTVSSVEGGNSVRNTSKPGGLSGLTREERDLAIFFKERGVMSIEEFRKSLEKIEENK